MRWIKMPLDFHRTVATVLPAHVQGTFYGCFTIARRSTPFRGYLMSASLRPLAIPDLSEELRVPPRTLYRHLELLTERGSVVRDLAGRYLVPLVLDVERRYPTRTTTTQTTSGENGDAPNLPEIAPTLPLVTYGAIGPPVAEPLLVVSSAEERRNVASIEDAGENPVSDAAFLGDAMAALPASIGSQDVRYLLAKLRRTAPAWRDFPRSDRDIALLERLESLSLGALLLALEQESLSPSAKRPGAWLSRTVPAIAMAQEVAS